MSHSSNRRHRPHLSPKTRLEYRHDQDDFRQPACYRSRRVDQFLSVDRIREQSPVYGRDGGLHGLERGDQRHAADPRKVEYVHESAHSAGRLERSVAGLDLRQPGIGRRHERGGRCERRNGRHQPGAGSRVYVQPGSDGPRRARLGWRVDGPGRNSRGGPHGMSWLLDQTSRLPEILSAGQRSAGSDLLAGYRFPIADVGTGPLGSIQRLIFVLRAAS